jgi:hypothetical protein
MWEIPADRELNQPHRHRFNPWSQTLERICAAQQMLRHAGRNYMLGYASARASAPLTLLNPIKYEDRYLTRRLLLIVG